MKNKIIVSIKENLKTIGWALLIAILIRSLIVQPFYIPSSSMEPTLLVGDRIFVIKYIMDIANIHFHLVQIFSIKGFFIINLKGDLVVSKPTDNPIDFIKKLIGIPGDSMIY